MRPRRTSMAEKTVRDIMTPDPVTVGPALSVTDAAKLMVEQAASERFPSSSGQACRARHRGRSDHQGHQARVSHLHPPARRLHHVSAVDDAVRARAEEGRRSDRRRRHDAGAVHGAGDDERRRRRDDCWSTATSRGSRCSTATSLSASSPSPTCCARWSGDPSSDRQRAGRGPRSTRRRSRRTLPRSRRSPGRARASWRS